MKPKGSPRLFRTTSKTKHKWSSRFFETTSGPTDKCCPNFFQTTSNIRYQGSRSSFKLLQKQNTGDLRDSFKLLQKHEIVVSEIFSHCFKNNAQKDYRDSLKLSTSKGVFSNYFKYKRKKFPRFFQITLSQTQGIFEILSNYFKNKTRNSQHSFKLFTSKTHYKWSPRFFQLL